MNRIGLVLGLLLWSGAEAAQLPSSSAAAGGTFRISFSDRQEGGVPRVQVGAGPPSTCEWESGRQLRCDVPQQVSPGPQKVTLGTPGQVVGLLNVLPQEAGRVKFTLLLSGAQVGHGQASSFLPGVQLKANPVPTLDRYRAALGRAGVSLNRPILNGQYPLTPGELDSLQKDAPALFPPGQRLQIPRDILTGDSPLKVLPGGKIRFEDLRLNITETDLRLPSFLPPSLTPREILRQLNQAPVQLPAVAAPAVPGAAPNSPCGKIVGQLQLDPVTAQVLQESPSKLAIDPTAVPFVGGQAPAQPVRVPRTLAADEGSKRNREAMSLYRGLPRGTGRVRVYLVDTFSAETGTRNDKYREVDLNGTSVEGHGSWLSGVIKEVGGLSNDDVQTYPACGQDGSCDLPQIIGAICDAANSDKPAVVNLSLGTPVEVPTLQQAMLTAMSRGVWFVVSHGNEDDCGGTRPGERCNHYPADWRGRAGMERLVSVGAVRLPALSPLGRKRKENDVAENGWSLDSRIVIPTAPTLYAPGQLWYPARPFERATAPQSFLRQGTSYSAAFITGVVASWLANSDAQDNFTEVCPVSSVSLAFRRSPCP